MSCCKMAHEEYELERITTSQLFREAILCSDTSTRKEEDPQHILSHRVPKQKLDTIKQDTKLCLLAMKILKEYNMLEAGIGELNLVEDVEFLSKLTQQCETETITIGIVGRSNSGKSTLINGLLYCKCLPQSFKAETVLPIPIQHDPDIHFGLCKSNPQSCCSHCPKLLINGSEHIGQNMILSALSKLNQDARAQNLTANTQSKHEQVMLMANIPSISCPKKWKCGYKICLVDNPGLGELNQLATREAKLAVATSTAYIYTMDCESIQLKEHVQIIKALLEEDHDLLQSGRMVIVVTKCDRIYENSEASRESREQKQIRDLVCDTLQRSLDVPVPYENVIPISGLWQCWIAQYETLDPRTRRSADKSAEDYTELMDDCEKPKDKLAALKHGSNYALLEERIARLVQDCLNYFQAKMKQATHCLVEWAMKQLNSYKDALQKEIIDQTEILEKFNQKIDEKKQLEQDITSTLHGDYFSGLKTSLSSAFKTDIEQIREEIFDSAKDQYSQFEMRCIEKQRNGYTSLTSLTDFEQFLVDMKAKVLTKIREQQYNAMHEVYFNAHKYVLHQFQKLSEAERCICQELNEATSHNFEGAESISCQEERQSYQEQLQCLPSDQIYELALIHEWNPEDTHDALNCLKWLFELLSKCFLTTTPDDASEDAGHRLKLRTLKFLLQRHRDFILSELESFLNAIKFQYVQYFLNNFAEHGTTHCSDHIEQRIKDAKIKMEGKMAQLQNSLKKVSELLDCFQSLNTNTLMQ